MTVEQRNRIKELFEAARALPPDSRAALWNEHGGEREVVAEVESLLAAYDTAPEFLEGSPDIAALVRLQPDAPQLQGRNLGPWRLDREVGRGGMGVVWEAHRDDREYEARVAVKLLTTAHPSEAAAARFREERQILARLDHPNIARLIDAGTSPDGYPYLVMDFVEGEPIDRWCDTRKTTLHQRLRLFLIVCEAVEYAHRHLVIHRDLKPANILVTPDGVPKLLDFGIAQLTAAGNAAPADRRPGADRALTPGYASPEQVRNDASTTASDVYSLGVLLYRLLTGHSPYGERDSSPLDTIRAICEFTPPAPSLVDGPFARQLRGELDAIVACSLRKEPEQRYRSVGAFADDVLACLELRPVRVLAESSWRRTARFVRRNRLASSAAALAIVSLAAGLTVATWQAGIAQRERNRAQARFRDVRRFSRSVLFELHDAIRNLPNSTPARSLLLTRATEFMDRLAKDSATDIPLKLELAEGYRRLGHVQGSSFSDNIGRPDDAIASFRKAIQLGEQAMAADPAQQTPIILLMGAYDDLTDALAAQGDRPGADQCYRAHLALTERAAAVPRSADTLRIAVATSFSNLAYYLSQQNDLPGAKQFYARAVAAFADLETRKSGTAESRAQYAFALKRLGAIRITDSALDDAERLYRTAFDLETAAAAADPASVRRQVDRTLTLSDLGLIAKKRNDLAAAARAYEEVVRVRRQAFEADRKNTRYWALLTSGMVYLANTYTAQGRDQEAIAQCREAIAMGTLLSADAPYRLLWQVERSRIALVHALVEAASRSARPKEREALRGAAVSELQTVKRFIDHTPDRNLSPSDRGLREDYLSAQTALEALR
jgi:non-specific serine/threonine protein kinase/serine/threonine-protein kinase